MLTSPPPAEITIVTPPGYPWQPAPNLTSFNYFVY
jgi:hypothetical protein